MKIQFRSLIVGLILGIIFMGFSSVSLAQMNKIDAFFNDIKININGKIIDTGNDKPFIYNGRTYLPARYVAEGLGAKVKWNETDNTVEITSQTSIPEPLNPTPLPTPNNTNQNINGIPEVFKDGLYFITYSNVVYVDIHSISSYIQYYKKPYQFGFNDSTRELYLMDSTKQIIVNNIPVVIINGKSNITYDYFINTIAPIIDYKRTN